MAEIIALRTLEETIRDFWQLLPQPHARKIVLDHSIMLIERESGMAIRGAHRARTLHELDHRLEFARKKQRRPIEYMLEVAELAFDYCE